MVASSRLAIGGLIIAALTAYLAFQGASRSWQYYLTVDECLNGPAAAGERIRVSGKIVAESLEISADRRQAHFRLSGTARNLEVICSGALPDNLSERLDVVVEGRLDQSGNLVGEKVLTRCASKYKSQGAPTSVQARTLSKARGGI